MLHYTIRGLRGQCRLKAGSAIVTEFSELSKLPLIYQLRSDAWKPDGIYPAPLDEHDLHARHSIVLDGERIIAAAQLCVHKRAVEVPEVEMYPVSLERYFG